MTRHLDAEVRPAAEADPVQLLRYIVGTWHAESVVAHGERMYPAQHAGFIAGSGDRIVGHVSYHIDGDGCEITSISADPQGAGTGKRLLRAVIETASAAHCHRVWLTTTNDDLDALRFYQRRGFRLSALRPGAVERARIELKPEIPEAGSFSIPMRDELDLELQIRLGDRLSE